MGTVKRGCRVSLHISRPVNVCTFIFFTQLHMLLRQHTLSPWRYSNRTINNMILKLFVWLKLSFMSRFQPSSLSSLSSRLSCLSRARVAFYIILHQLPNLSKTNLDHLQNSFDVSLSACFLFIVYLFVPFYISLSLRLSIFLTPRSLLLSLDPSRFVLPPAHPPPLRSGFSTL